MSRELNLKEQGILELIAKGFTAREIAEELQISQRYTNLLTYHILNKLGAKNRVEAAVLAVRNGLVN